MSDLTHICIKETSLLAIVIEIILSYPLRLWLINRPAVLQKVKNHLTLPFCPRYSHVSVIDYLEIQYIVIYIENVTIQYCKHYFGQCITVVTQ